MARIQRLASALGALLLASIASAGGPPPNWPAVAAVETIQIRTSDEGGTLRERTIWLLVHDSQAYIRAGGTSSWDSEIDHQPDVSVQIEGVWYELRATRIPEGPLCDAVASGLREKYGSSDVLIGLFRAIGGKPRILRLDPRAGIPME